uniref:R-spondin 4 n=1 Tax=Astyanax mexicanus TaxID=7994 RepID=A0A8B9LB99_ASTMX
DRIGHLTVVRVLISKWHNCFSHLTPLYLCLVSREVWMQGCRSCSECSRENGCLRCSDRLFLFLHRDGMSHHGSCLHSCPAGHYGLRGTDANRCITPECERCFDKDFCTKCKRGFLLYKGKCLSSCPEVICVFSLCLEDCVFSTAGNWAEWSPCLYNGLSCGVRWGRQNRTRVLSWRTPEELSELCPPQSESRKCRLKKRCRKGKRCVIFNLFTICLKRYLTIFQVCVFITNYFIMNKKCIE